jgi:integrase
MPKGRPPYVSEWMLHWLHNIARRKVEATTWDRSYRQKVTELIVPWFERTLLPDLTEEDIETWHANLERVTSVRTGRPLSAATIAQAHRIMSTAIKEAVVRKRIARNPCSNVTPPQAGRREFTLPSAAEVEAILERCRTWPNGARWILAFATGLRQGEALALEWRNVTLAGEPAVTITASAARTAAGLVTKAPKSARSRRVIPLTAGAVAALKAHRAAQDVADIGGLVFTDSKGGPVHPRQDWQNWQNLLKDLGLPHYRVHDIRHTTATMLLERGADSRVVAEILGHAKATFTQDTYQQVRPALRRQAVDLLAEMNLRG